MTPPAATAGRALPRTVAPRAPRRVSGPSSRPRPSARGGAATRRSTAAAEPLAVRALRRGRTMADSPLLARLIGGRLWIPLVAAGLIGIVFMQVSMLRLNAGISRDVDRASILERDNATLRADVSRLESGERIDRMAGQLGMVEPGTTGDHYVLAARGDAARAAIRMTSPDPSAIARAQAAVAAATAPSLTASTTSTTAAPAAATTTPAAPAASSTTSAPATAATTAAPAAVATPSTAAPASATPAAPAAATTAPAQQPATTAPSGGVAAPTSGQA